MPPVRPGAADDPVLRLRERHRGARILLVEDNQINVEVGQFVLAGEPVAVMGDTGSAPSAGAGGRNDPVLYVEFRKDGGSIDPDPWWAKGSSEKVRG